MSHEGQFGLQMVDEWRSKRAEKLLKNMDKTKRTTELKHMSDEPPKSTRGSQETESCSSGVIRSVRRLCRAGALLVSSPHRLVNMWWIS